MKLPSVKTIAKIPKVTPEQAKLVRLALTASISDILQKFHRTGEWERSCLHMPSEWNIRMEACDEALGTQGLEVYGAGNWRIDYCDPSDPYVPTLCFEFRAGLFGYHLRRVFVGSYGDWAEKHGKTEK